MNPSIVCLFEERSVTVSTSIFSSNDLSFSLNPVSISISNDFVTVSISILNDCVTASISFSTGFARISRVFWVFFDSFSSCSSGSSVRISSDGPLSTISLFEVRVMGEATWWVSSASISFSVSPEIDVLSLALLSVLWGQQRVFYHLFERQSSVEAISFSPMATLFVSHADASLIEWNSREVQHRAVGEVQDQWFSHCKRPAYWVFYMHRLSTRRTMTSRRRYNHILLWTSTICGNSQPYFDHNIDTVDDLTNTYLDESVV